MSDLNAEKYKALVLEAFDTPFERVAKPVADVRRFFPFPERRRVDWENV